MKMKMGITRHAVGEVRVVYRILRSRDLRTDLWYIIMQKAESPLHSVEQGIGDLLAKLVVQGRVGLLITFSYDRAPCSPKSLVHRCPRRIRTQYHSLLLLPTLRRDRLPSSYLLLYRSNTHPLQISFLKRLPLLSPFSCLPFLRLLSHIQTFESPPEPPHSPFLTFRL